eukprot:gene42406-52587_t
MTSTSLVLGAGALFWHAFRSAPRSRLFTSAFTGSLIASVGFSTLFGYAANLPAIYRSRTDVSTPQLSAIGLLVLGLMLLLLAWRDNLRGESGPPAGSPLPPVIGCLTLTLILWVGLRDSELAYLGSKTNTAMDQIATSIRLKLQSQTSDLERLARRWSDGPNYAVIWDADAAAQLGESTSALGASFISYLDRDATTTWLYPKIKNEGLLGIRHREDSVRADVRAWLEANWSPELGLVEWRNKLADSGWGVPTWPKEWYGRDLPQAFQAVVDEEFARIGAIGVAKAGIRTLAAATILAHGTDLHKEKFLRRILTGEDTWCQLFSEPGSGSDVAGAVTRAEMSGNKWSVNGQKVWPTSAHHAHWGLLLARTDWDQTKHKGLSYFIIDMHQPGVNVQPLKQMNGHASFNQVFMTDAVVEPEFLVANVGDGWAVTTTTLMHERRGADGLRTWAMGSDRKGRAYDEERAEIATTMEPYKWYPQRAGRVDLILSRAKETGHLDDPVVRQEIAKLLTMSKAAEWTARLDLACCYRLFDHLGWTELIFNHITLRVDEA